MTALVIVAYLCGAVTGVVLWSLFCHHYHPEEETAKAHQRLREATDLAYKCGLLAGRLHERHHWAALPREVDE